MKADYGAVNKSVSEYWMESWEREVLPCPACRRELTCWTSRRTRAGIWSLICCFFFFFFLSHFHYFTTVWKWCFMKWTSSAARNVQISSVAAPLPPTLLSWIPLFCSFWLPFFCISPQTYQYYMTTSSIFPKPTYYSPVILPRFLFKSWFLHFFLIYISFFFLCLSLPLQPLFSRDRKA